MTLRSLTPQKQICNFALWAILQPVYGLHVMVDPGHGGKDLGATYGPVIESAITLRVGLLLRDVLEAKGFQVSLTRDKDEHKSLSDRVEAARIASADVFISIHLNASEDPNAYGAEFYFQNQLPPSRESLSLALRENLHAEGDRLAQMKQYHLKLTEFFPSLFLTADRPESFISGGPSVLMDLMDQHRVLQSHLLSVALQQEWSSLKQEQRSSRGHRPRRSIRQAPFYVLTYTHIPSVLIELGYLTHRSDFRRLSQPATWQESAHDIARALQMYKESMDKPKPLDLEFIHARRWSSTSRD